MSRGQGTLTVIVLAFALGQGGASAQLLPTGTLPTLAESSTGEPPSEPTSTNATLAFTAVLENASQVAMPTPTPPLIATPTLAPTAPSAPAPTAPLPTSPLPTTPLPTTLLPTTPTPPLSLPLPTPTPVAPAGATSAPTIPGLPLALDPAPTTAPPDAPPAPGPTTCSLSCATDAFADPEQPYCVMDCPALATIGEVLCGPPPFASCTGVELPALPPEALAELGLAPSSAGAEEDARPGQKDGSGPDSKGKPTAEPEDAGASAAPVPLETPGLGAAALLLALAGAALLARRARR